MIERTIILPVKDNAGNDQTSEVGHIIDEIISITSGVSISHVDGYWKDESKILYTDRGNVKLTTTIDEETDKLLRSQLPWYCERLKQVALYTHKAEVEVEFVECRAIPQAA